ncbi:MAG: fibronectin type III domain-containing protein [Thermoplasmatota archaeon]
MSICGERNLDLRREAPRGAEGRLTTFLSQSRRSTGFSNIRIFGTLIAVAMLATPALPGLFASAAPVGGAGTDPAAANLRTGTLYSTIDAAIAAAQPGDTIAVQNGTYPEQVNVTQSVTLCSTVDLLDCAPIDTPARYATFSSATWGRPPVNFSGEALRMDASTGASTSLFLTDAATGTLPHVGIMDIKHASFDMLVQSGTCPAGGIRLVLHLNLSGTGSTVDGNLSVFPGASFACPAVGTWTHVDLMQGDWGSAGVATTQAAAAAALPANAQIVKMNLIVDGGTTSDIIWIDNQRFQDSFFREPSDEACDTGAGHTYCTEGRTEYDSLPNTILASPTAFGVVVSANDVTVRGFTINPSGSAASPNRYGVTVCDAGHASGSAPCVSGNSGSVENPSIIGNVVKPASSVGGVGLTGIFMNGANAVVSGNNVSGWSDGIDLRGETSNAIVSNNSIGTNVEGLLDSYANGTQALGNSFTGNELAIAINSSPLYNPVYMAVHANTIRGAKNTLAFRSGSEHGVIDARDNDWGAYNRSLIEATMANVTGNSVDIRCYIASDGKTQVCPHASFTDTTQAVHRVASFTDTSTETGSNTITSRKWSFGDGSSPIVTTGTAETHTYAKPGTYTVTLTITDSERFTDTASSLVTFTDAGAVFTPVPAQTGRENQMLSFTVQAKDADGDAVTVTAANLPTGATFKAATGAFSWTPAVGQNGTYDLTFSATDGFTTPSVLHVSATILPAFELPSAPLGLSANAGSAVITLTWSAPTTNGGTAITGYQVNRGTSSGAERILAELGTVTTYTDTTPAGGVTYYYAVQAVNSVGVGAASAESSAIILTTPGLPTDVAAVPSDAGVTVSWVAAPNGGSAIEHYSIWRAEQSGAETLLAMAGGSATSYLDTSAVPGVTYYYFVSATNAIGNGGSSAEVVADPHISVTLAVAGANSAKTSPNAPVSFSFTVKNGALVTDTYVLAPSAPSGWSVSGPSTVQVAPGATQTVVFQVTPNAGQARGTVTLSATSSLKPSVHASSTVVVTVPVFVTIQLSSSTYGLLGVVTGSVTVTYLDGSGVSSLNVQVVETSSTVSGARTIDVTTDGNGTATFSFANNPTTTNFLGAHTVVATALGTLGNGVRASEGYTVAASP